MTIRQSWYANVLAVAVVAATASAFLVQGARAQQDPAIPSTSAGALPVPEAWACDRIAREYRDWLKDGNSPESWKYVGPTWRSATDGKTYNWDDWLAWHKGNCGAIPGETNGVPDNAMLIGGIVGALGITALAAGSGGGSSGNDSPG